MFSVEQGRGSLDETTRSIDYVRPSFILQLACPLQFNGETTFFSSSYIAIVKNMSSYIEYEIICKNIYILK